MNHMDVGFDMASIQEDVTVEVEADRYRVQHTREIANSEDFDESFFRYAKW